jgi:hypothetical protein
MVALSPSPSANERLEDFEQALGGNAEFAVVETPEELEDAVEEDLETLSVEIDELAELEAESNELTEATETAIEGEEGGEETGEETGTTGDEGEIPPAEQEGETVPVPPQAGGGVTEEIPALP